MPLSLTSWIGSVPVETLWNKDLLFIVLAVSAGYLFVAEKEPLSVKGKFLFGVWLFFLCWGSPLQFFGHLLFSVHMFKMSVLYFFVPPLLLAGLPAGWRKRAGAAAAIRRLRRLRFHPFAAIVLFNGLFLLYHIPAVMERIMTQPSLHAAFHTVLFGASILLWLPVVGWTASDQLSAFARMRYMRINVWILMPACLLLLSSLIQYGHFTDLHRQLAMIGVCFPETASTIGELSAFRLLSPLHDHQLGGALMLAAHKTSFGFAERLGRAPAAASGPTGKGAARLRGEGSR